MRIDAARTVGGRAPSHTPTTRLLALTSVLLGILFSSGTVAASGGGDGSAYINGIPKNRPLGIYVFGDSFGSELADGLKWSFRKSERISVKKRTKPASGLVRIDQYDWLKTVRRTLSREKVDVAIIAIGGNDRQDLRVRGKRYERFSIGWRMEYMKRLEKLARVLSQSGAAVYWVGLPNVRSKRMTRDYARFNRYFKSVAESHGMKYIGIRQLFTAARGGYSAFGKGLRGKTVRLRDKDGIHLTIVGAKKLGRFIAGQIRDDLPRNDG